MTHKEKKQGDYGKQSQAVVGGLWREIGEWQDLGLEWSAGARPGGL